MASGGTWVPRLTFTYAFGGIWDLGAQGRSSARSRARSGTPYIVTPPPTLTSPLALLRPCRPDACLMYGRPCCQPPPFIVTSQGCHLRGG
eukprot:9486983-Pyramimonas_sp.AAC.1